MELAAFSREHRNIAMLLTLGSCISILLNECKKNSQSLFALYAENGEEVRIIQFEKGRMGRKKEDRSREKEKKGRRADG